MIITLNTMWALHHQRVRPTYLHVEKPVAYCTAFNRPSGLRGCVESGGIQTNRAGDWNPILNVDDIGNTNPVGRQRDDVSIADVISGNIGSISPMTSISK